MCSEAKPIHEGHKGVITIVGGCLGNGEVQK